MKYLTKNNYPSLLKDIKSILEKGLTRAYKSVDNIKVQTYWQIGERIAREEMNMGRADYGKNIIQKLSLDLKLHERTLYRTLKFYKAYPILTTVLSELSWSHYLMLVDIKNSKKRKFYEIKSVKESWSVRDLKIKINAKEYERAKKEGKVITREDNKHYLPENIFKESYNWDFISLKEKYTEKELENALIDNIQRVLLEFGKGFAFLARQQKILINNQWHKIDLLFYHILLKCYIIVELKARELKPGDIEQITRYLTYFREKKVTNDRDPIALIICKDHNKIGVYYSAGKNNEDIFVAEYKTKLPSEKEIKLKLKQTNNKH